jgi:hypothetical protein
MWSVPRSYKQDSWSSEFSCQLTVVLCTEGYEHKTCACEAEESPLLEDVTRERLVKTQQAGKCLMGVVVILEYLPAGNDVSTVDQESPGNYW